MRRLSFISLILLVGARPPRRSGALAQAGTPPPPAQQADASAAAGAAGRRSAGRRSGRDRARAQPVRADRPGALHRRPRDQHRRRPGALSALPGRPRRAALLRLPLFVGAARRRLHLRRAREQRRLARSAYFAEYNRVGRMSVIGSWQQIPQFYSVDTMTPYTGSGGTLVLDDAAQRAAQGGAGLNPYPPIAPQFDLLERRDIGRVEVKATPTPKLDVTASFTTQKHGGELPFGASFGFSNDVEVALPYDSRANDFTIGTEWTNAKSMLRVAYSGSWFDNLADHARLGQPAAHRRRGRLAGTRPHVAVALELGADDQLRRLHQAGAQDADHRVLLLRPVEQRRAAAAVHDQFGAADDCTAARQRGCRSARVLDEPEPDVAPHAPTGDSARATAITPTPTRCRRRASRTTSPTTRTRRRPPPAVPISTPTTGPRSTPTRRGAG